ncbi:hypothetical protein [Rhizobium leguminosarum]|uniref:hypothetical protein n=1 Tax=Rhizobium leguminosarum TaxID=384 RepID=UPI001E11E086|nr:hypothetical protein [Rhizobium leguminosarum]MBP2449033.1 hypothetical protein [Rhizobium leguminosarum]
MNVLMFNRVRNSRDGTDAPFVITDGDNWKLYRFALQYDGRQELGDGNMGLFLSRCRRARGCDAPIADDVRPTLRRGGSLNPRSASASPIMGNEDIRLSPALRPVMKASISWKIGRPIKNDPVCSVSYSNEEHAYRFSSDYRRKK